MRDCTVNNDVGTGDFSLALEILHVRGHAHVRSHMSTGMGWTLRKSLIRFAYVTDHLKANISFLDSLKDS